MKKILSVIMLLALFLSACSPQPTTPKALSEAELRSQLIQHKAEKNYELVYEDALKIIELGTEDTEIYLDAATALLEMSKAYYAEIDRLLLLGAEKTEGVQVLAAWATENQPKISLVIPFASDYISEEQINFTGTTAGNLTNAAKYANNWWQGGLLIWQADWVYFVQPNENFAIYKVRTDNSGLQRVGEAYGHSLNVTGDWIYYLNIQDGDKPYKMRTDGSMNTKISEDECGFLSVSGDWLYFGQECLYKMRNDGSEKTALTESLPIFPCVVGDWVYYSEKSEAGGLWRVSTNGGAPQQVAPGFVQTYCILDDWIYYVDQNQWTNFWRVKTDGTGAEVVFQFDSRIASFNVSENMIYLSVEVKEEHDGFAAGTRIVALDRDTLEQQWSLDADTEPLCIGPEGRLYFFKFGEGMRWYYASVEGAAEQLRVE